ncbi:MAG: hypothetical protein WCS69_07430 [Ignavibacteriaceae bacterium]|jgi:hypothetical protein
MEKKQKIILWISAIVVAVLLSYFKNVTSEEYPITGTTAVDGEKVTYAFDKIYRGKEDFKISLRTDSEQINGSVIWWKTTSVIRDTVQLKKEKGFLSCSIPLQKPETEIWYKVYLHGKETTIQVPSTLTLHTKFLGFVPTSISSTFVLTFFLGLLLSIRIGLAFFEERAKTKTFALFTLISFSMYGFFLVPVKNLFELGAVNQRVPQFFEMFSLPELSFALVWIVVTIGMFNSKNKMWNVAGAVATVAAYLIVR